MEHPPKQGLKLQGAVQSRKAGVLVLMEHPPKQGLKLQDFNTFESVQQGFNGTSTKTRIETPFRKQFLLLILLSF